MNTLYGIIIAVVVVVLVVSYNLYVGVVKKKNNVKEAMGGIDVQLNKRYDLIPNILIIAKKFMEHERGLIEEVTKLRSQAAGLRSNPDTIAEKLNLDNAIATKMGQLMVSVENYPQLKSDQTMIQAMQTYAEVEEHIAAARRFYNSAVKELNNAVEIFPSSIFAAMLGITQCPFYEAPEVAKSRINAADYLNNN